VTSGDRNSLAPWCDSCPLRALPIFEEFSSDELDFMLKFKTAHRHAERGKTLIRHGESVNHVCTLFSGWALRHRLLPDGRRQIVLVLLPGDMIGLDTIFLQPPQYSIQALSDITYCVLDTQLLAAMPLEQPRLAQRLMKLALIEQRVLETRMTVLGRCSAEERIAYLVLDLHQRLSRRRLMNGYGFAFPLTQQQLADAAGLNIIHTNRVLRRLRMRDILTIQNHRAQIHDMAALQRLVTVGMHDGARPLF
jgi:CRP-like cAMP-binding protein